jgi:hypothetical protein
MTSASEGHIFDLFLLQVRAGEPAKEVSKSSPSDTHSWIQRLRRTGCAVLHTSSNGCPDVETISMNLGNVQIFATLNS